MSQEIDDARRKAPVDRCPIPPVSTPDSAHFRPEITPPQTEMTIHDSKAVRPNIPPIGTDEEESE